MVYKPQGRIIFGVVGQGTEADLKKAYNCILLTEQK